MEELPQAHFRKCRPENVLVSFQGDALIADFGLSRRLLASDPVVVSDSPPMPTQPGTLIYMAPEVYQGASMSVKSDVWSLGVLLVEMLQGTIHGRRVGGRVGAGQSFDVNYLLLQQTTAFDGAATACSPDGSFPVTLPADLNESCFHELLRRMLVVDPLSRADCGELLRGAHVEEIRKLASDDADRAAREYASASQNLKEMKAEAERAQREASMCNLQAIRATAELEEANTRVSRLTAERDALRNALLEAQRTADASSRSDFETQLCHAEDNLRHALDLVSAAKRELDLAIARRVDAMGLMDRSQWELSQAELNVRRLTESESGVRSMMDASLLRSFRSYRTERD